MTLSNLTAGVFIGLSPEIPVPSTDGRGFEMPSTTLARELGMTADDFEKQLLQNDVRAEAALALASPAYL